MTKKETADILLNDFGLLKELEKYGKPHPVGSYRMDMMAWNDIDIDVENDGMSLEKLYGLTKFILERFRPTWYEAKEELTPDGKKVWMHGFETVYDGELWNFDIWFFDKADIERAERYCDSVATRMTDKQKNTAVEIKRELIRRGLYSFEQYRSIDVYKAVLDMNVKDADEFIDKYDISLHRENPSSLD